MNSFAVSFKGGMSLGFGSIGVIRFLQEHKLKPKIYAGSSSGAMVATMYALDKPWTEMAEMLTDFNFLTITSLRSLLKKGSLVDYDKYRSTLLRFQPDMTFDELPNKLLVFVTDPLDGERIIIEKGSIVDAILASSGYPPIFPPVRLGHYYNKVFIDGDFTVGYSAGVLKKNYGVEKVIGSRYRDTIRTKDITSGFIRRTMLIMKLLSRSIERQNDLYTPPDIEIKYSAKGVNRFKFKDVHKIIRNAYVECCRNEEFILAELTESTDKQKTIQ